MALGPLIGIVAAQLEPPYWLDTVRRSFLAACQRQAVVGVPLASLIATPGGLATRVYVDWPWLSSAAAVLCSTLPSRWLPPPLPLVRAACFAISSDPLLGGLYGATACIITLTLPPSPTLNRC